MTVGQLVGRVMLVDLFGIGRVSSGVVVVVVVVSDDVIIVDDVDPGRWLIEIQQAYVDIGIPCAANVAHVNGHGDDVGVVRVDMGAPQRPSAHDLDPSTLGQIPLRDAHDDGGIHPALESRKRSRRFHKRPPSETGGGRDGKRRHVQQPAQVMARMGGGRFKHLPRMNHHRRFRDRKPNRGHRRGERGGDGGVVERGAIVVRGRRWWLLMVMMMMMVMMMVMWRLMMGRVC